LAEETELLGENLLHCHFVQHTSHKTRPGIEAGKTVTELWYDQSGVLLLDHPVRWLILPEEMTAVYSENYMKYVIEKYINGKFVICTLLKL
jgi:hypothetical protein